MPAITFDKFDLGIDLRKGASVSDANRLREMRNAFVTTGLATEKRPGLTKVATLEPGTKGLFSAFGKLHTFYSQGDVVHANPLFHANKVEWSGGAADVKDVPYADVFNAYIYAAIEYDNGKVEHHYLDDTDTVTPWAPDTPREVGQTVRPTTANGFRYEVTDAGQAATNEPTWATVPGVAMAELEASYLVWQASATKKEGAAYRATSVMGHVFKNTNGGASGPTEPNWPTELGATITEDGTGDIAWDDNTEIPLGAIRRPTAANGYTYEATTAGTTGNTQPAWPTTNGGTVADGTVIWTCRMQEAWAANKVLAAGAIRKPTASNAFWYEVTTEGATAGTEPTWPTVAGQTVTEKAATATAYANSTALPLGAIRRPTVANGYLYEVTAAGTTGAAQPAWPLVPGATVTSGTVVFTCRKPVVWTCRAKAAYECVAMPKYRCHRTEIYDPNCPHTNGVLKAASKMFGIAGDVVRYSKTGDPRNWSEPNDAGFLPTGLNSRGDRNANALGLYRNNLVVLSRDGAQVWLVDPDPTAMKLDNVVENVGTSSPRSVANVSGDLYFLSDYGFRSITTLQYTNNLADVDVGSPIDSLVRESLKEPGVFPRATFFYGTGQYVCAVGNQVFIYSISRTAKIAAWSRYFFREEVQAFAELGQELYLRMGDDVFKLDPAAKTDDGTQYEVLIDLPYMDLKTPGQLKRVYGADVVVNGKCEFSVGFDVRDPDAYTTPVRVKGNTRPSGMLPVECSGTEFALRFRNYDAGEFRLDSVTLYYDVLGAV